MTAPGAAVRPFTREDARRDLAERVFAPSAHSRVGIEAELIPLRAPSMTPVPIRGEDGSLPLLREHADRYGWPESVSPYGSPRFGTGGGGWLSFEPGGQLEWSSSPHGSADELLELARGAVGPLQTAAREAGLRLLARGMDPLNPLDGAPLVLGSARYLRMARYLEDWAPYGARMMRQTASIHVNLDFGPDPLRRWRAANALAPYLVAVFASSSRYQGRDTGHRSYRAHQWRNFDPLRSGVLAGACGPEDLFRRAMDAPDFLHAVPGQSPAPFGARLDGGTATPEEWASHLSTFFLEVRPRGYLEVRCVDALPPRWYAAPLVFLVGLLYDPATMDRVLDRVPDPTHEALVVAGRQGLSDPELSEAAARLFREALEGASRLGREVVGDAALAEAEAFYQRFTARGLDPGHEADTP